MKTCHHPKVMHKKVVYSGSMPSKSVGMMKMLLLPSMRGASASPSSPVASTLFLMLLLLVMVSNVGGANGPNDPTIPTTTTTTTTTTTPPPSCIGNELQSVIGTCGGAFSSGSGSGPGPGSGPGAGLSPNSGCCIALRSVSLPCLCSQLASSGLASAISPATATSIRTACHLRIPPRTRCAGFSVLQT